MFYTVTARTTHGDVVPLTSVAADSDYSALTCAIACADFFWGFDENTLLTVRREDGALIVRNMPAYPACRESEALVRQALDQFADQGL